MVMHRRFFAGAQLLFFGSDGSETQTRTAPLRAALGRIPAGHFEGWVTHPVHMTAPAAQIRSPYCDALSAGTETGASGISVSSKPVSRV